MHHSLFLDMLTIHESNKYLNSEGMPKMLFMVTHILM